MKGKREADEPSGSDDGCVAMNLLQPFQ